VTILTVSHKYSTVTGILLNVCVTEFSNRTHQILFINGVIITTYNDIK